MSVRLEVSTEIAAPIDRVWNVLADWEGQSRWIPLTTVRVLTAHREGLGVRAAALSGFWLGSLPIGLLDRFIVTGWSPPDGNHAEAGDPAPGSVLHRRGCLHPSRARGWHDGGLH